MVMHDPYRDKSTFDAKLKRMVDAVYSVSSLSHSKKLDMCFLLAPEYYFANAEELWYANTYASSKGKIAPASPQYTMTDYQVVVDTFKHYSSMLSNAIIIPGTFMLQDQGYSGVGGSSKKVGNLGGENYGTDPAYSKAVPGLFGELKGGGGSPSFYTTSVYNMAPVFYAGRVGVYRKRAPYYELGQPATLAARKKFYQHNPQSDEYVRNQYRYVPGVVPGYFRRGPKGRQVAIGLEICFDHACGMLRNDLDKKTVGRSDVHIILSASTDIDFTKVCARSGGYVVHCSSVATDCEVQKYKRRRWWSNSLDVVTPYKRDSDRNMVHWLVDLEDEKK